MRLSVHLSAEDLAAVDSARGDLTRYAFVKRAVLGAVFRRADIYVGRPLGAALHVAPGGTAGLATVSECEDPEVLAELDRYLRHEHHRHCGSPDCRGECLG